MRWATPQLESAVDGAAQALEVMATDVGPDPAGRDRTLPGNYPIGAVHIGPSPSVVRLIDARDNDGRGQDFC